MAIPTEPSLSEGRTCCWTHARGCCLGQSATRPGWRQSISQVHRAEYLLTHFPVSNLLGNSLLVLESPSLSEVIVTDRSEGPHSLLCLTPCLMLPQRLVFPQAWFAQSCPISGDGTSIHQLVTQARKSEVSPVTSSPYLTGRKSWGLYCQNIFFEITYSLSSLLSP